MDPTIPTDGGGTDAVTDALTATDTTSPVDAAQTGDVASNAPALGAHGLAFFHLGDKGSQPRVVRVQLA
ncbi:hypothetical protein BH09MYX1_BH09MYX1_64440 [soil metagenome]